MARRAISGDDDLALTFDDVLLLPRSSDLLPSEANVASRVTRTIGV